MRPRRNSYYCKSLDKLKTQKTMNLAELSSGYYVVNTVNGAYNRCSTLEEAKELFEYKLKNVSSNWSILDINVKSIDTTKFPPFDPNF